SNSAFRDKLARIPGSTIYKDVVQCSILRPTMALPIKGAFLRHKNSDIPRWARSLNHVRFCHPADLMVLDREIFLVAIEIPETEKEFVELCDALGITVSRIEPGDAVAQAGVRYTPDEWKHLKF